MIRTDQILKITADVEGMMRAKGYTNHYAEAFADGFHEGASWADSNPCCWHKCEDGLPEPNIKVLCYTKKGTYFVAWTEDTHWGLKWSRWNCPIIAWMELPQPPKFD